MPAPSASAPADVVFLINSLEGGGAERIVALLLQQFAAPENVIQDLRARLVLLDDKPFAYPIPPNTEVDVLAAGGALVPSVMRLYRGLQRKRPAIVVAHLARANFAAVCCGRWLGLPVIITEHVNTSSHFAGRSLRARVSKLLVRALYRGADRVVAVSEGVAQDLTEQFALPPDLLTVIPTPFDLDRIHGLAAELPEKAVPDDFVVAIGRLTANKNFPLLLRAYALAGIAPALVVLGDGGEGPALRALVQDLGIAPRVHFLGFVQNPYAIMGRARAFVSSSNAEGFPVAAGEALALGRPVLMTDCPSGPAELLGGQAPAGAGVVRGRFGMLCPVNDVAALTAGLQAIIGPEALALATAGRQRMEAMRPEAIAQRHATLISEMLDKRRHTV